MSNRWSVGCLFLLACSLQLKGQVLFYDPFETIVKLGNHEYTKANVFKGRNLAPGGETHGKAQILPGKTGKALRLSGQSRVVYAPAEGNIDPMGGEITFDVALQFDPMEKNEKTRDALRNQFFVTVEAPPGGCQVCLYNSASDFFIVAVRNPEGNIVFSKAFRKTFKRGQWHTFSLKWGREIELWCDGEKQVSGAWEGLFGSIPVNLKEGRIVLGAARGGGMESEFFMDELMIKGPSAAQITTRPRIMIPLQLESVTIDGSLEDSFWKKASRITGFVKYDQNLLAANQPVAYAAYTQQGLYIGLEAKLPPGTLPRATLTARDSAIFSEDGLEVHLNPAGDSHVYQFIASALGTQFDRKVTVGEYQGKLSGYQPDWQVKTKNVPGGWTSEIFIPFASFDGKSMPKPGDVWKGNFIVISANGPTNAACWSYVNGKPFVVPTYFGELLFTGRERTLRESRLSGFDSGEPQVDLDLVGDYKPIITAKCEMFNSAATSIYKNSMLIKDTTAISFKLPIVMTGDYIVMLSGVDETGSAIFRQQFGFKTDKSFDLTVENYPYGGYLKFQATVKKDKEPFGKIAITVTGPDHKVAGTAEIKSLNNGVGIGRLSSESLSPGQYLVQASLISSRGAVLEIGKQNIQIFEKPKWWKNNLGIDHSVPPPFEPVKDHGDKLRVWGRDYVLKNGNFPVQITSQKKELFALAPIFTLKADGKSVDLVTLKAGKGENYPDAVSRIAKATVGSLSVESQLTLEFDGMLRYDLDLAPATSTTVEKLILEIVLPKDLAKFLLTSNCGTSSISVLDKNYSSGFIPYVWLGNDDMGFSWFTEKDQYWNPRNNQAIQIIPEMNKVVFRVNFITQPIVLKGPITLTFGLQATPLRPIPEKDPYAYPMYRERGDISFAEYLTYPQAGNIKPEQGTVEFWVNPHGNPDDSRNMEIFRIGSEKNHLTAYLLSPTEPNTLWIYQGNTRILVGKIPFTKNSFTHLALTWDEKSASLYADGKLISTLTGPVLKTLKGALAEKEGRIVLGAYEEKTGYTAITLDEIRISDTVRYAGESFAVAGRAFEKDDHTLLLDHLNETFKPDGQDAETRGGGVPSIGSRFVPAKFDQGLFMQVEPPQPNVEVTKKLGIYVINYWYWIQDIVDFAGQPYLNAPLSRNLKDDLKQYRKYDFNINPYMAAPNIVSASGLIEPFGAEWMVRPRSTMRWTFRGTPEGYYWLNCCQNARGFSDYLAAYLVWTLNLGFDGFYTDGLTSVLACQNQDHGCGYLDEAGNLHATYAIFATRQTLKRMYRITKARNPRGIVVNHCSFNMCTPIMSFSDIVYTGEHEDYENLLTTRLRFSNKPWGLYTTTIGSSTQEYSPVHVMSCLLNGTSVWGSGIVGRKDMARKEFATRTVYHNFNTRSSIWVPYYQGENVYYTVADPNVKVSQYYHPGKDILLVAANYNSAAQSVTINLNLQKYGLAGKPLNAINALTEEKINLSESGRMIVSIKPKSFRLIRIAVE